MTSSHSVLTELIDFNTRTKHQLVVNNGEHRGSLTGADLGHTNY